VHPWKKGTLGQGDVYTWTVVPSWLVGQHSAFYAKKFINDLAGRLASRPQVTTDGLKLYINAIDEAFGADVDYAMLVKLYGDAYGNENERRYSPAECCGTITGTVCGMPDENHISTGHVERQNLTMHMSMRRFTRLTNGFSKKIENHEHAVAIHYMYYNFGRIHKTLRVTSAMEAGVSDHVWSLEKLRSSPIRNPHEQHRKMLLTAH
jgi:hypothetical protein